MKQFSRNLIKPFLKIILNMYITENGIMPAENEIGGPLDK